MNSIFQMPPYNPPQFILELFRWLMSFVIAAVWFFLIVGVNAYFKRRKR